MYSAITVEMDAVCNTAWETLSNIQIPNSLYDTFRRNTLSPVDSTFVQGVITLFIY